MQPCKFGPCQPGRWPPLSGISSSVELGQQHRPQVCCVESQSLAAAHQEGSVVVDANQNCARRQCLTLTHTHTHTLHMHTLTESHTFTLLHTCSLIHSHTFTLSLSPPHPLLHTHTTHPHTWSHALTHIRTSSVTLHTCSVTLKLAHTQGRQSRSFGSSSPLARAHPHPSA